MREKSFYDPRKVYEAILRAALERPQDTEQAKLLEVARNSILDLKKMDPTEFWMLAVRDLRRLIGIGPESISQQPHYRVRAARELPEIMEELVRRTVDKSFIGQDLEIKRLIALKEILPPSLLANPEYMSELYLQSFKSGQTQYFNGIAEMLPHDAQRALGKEACWYLDPQNYYFVFYKVEFDSEGSKHPVSARDAANRVDISAQQEGSRNKVKVGKKLPIPIPIAA